MTASTADELPNAAPVAIVMFVYGAFLLGTGFYGAMSHDFAPKAMHSLYAGAGGAIAMAAASAATIVPNRKSYMIGVHVGLLLQLVFTVVFAVQAVRSFGNPEKADRLALFCVMLLGSVAALIAMRMYKPKAKAKSK